MSINWEVLGIILLTLVVLAALAVVVISYVRHWAARHDMTGSNLGEGKYFQRYVSEDEQARHQAEQNSYLDKKKKSVQRIKITLIAGFVVSLLSGIVISLYVNRDGLTSEITLSEEEIKNLVVTHHHWQDLYAENIPSLNKQLTKIRPHGLVLVGRTQPSGNAKQDRIRASARMVWEQFAEENKLPVNMCDWNAVSECMTVNKDALFVLLPDFWHVDKIRHMMGSGIRILAYDAPLQVVNNTKDTSFSIYDLTFEPAIDNSHSVFVLAGDRELSLGFDAGTILDIESNFNFYQASSSKPQGLAIDSDHAAGGVFKTRLYAKAEGEGRLVWMDFSPNQADHAESIDIKYFNGVVASIFRYLNKESYQAIATWPEGKPFAALIEEDTEDKFVEAGRVSDFFKENNYPVTWYILSGLAQKNRAVARKLAESGQIACHGDHHRAFTLSDLQAQTERLALCQKTLFEITGRKATSFRPPQEKHSQDTLDSMINNGFTHYIAEHGIDRFVPVIKQSKETGKELTSIPRMVTDDFALWVEMRASAEQSKAITLKDMNYVEAVSGLYMFSFHTQFMEHDKYFSVVKHVAHNVHNKNAYFETAQNVMNWWKFRSRLITGKKVHPDDLQAYKPVMLMVNKDGQLYSKQYLSTAVTKNKTQNALTSRK